MAIEKPRHPILIPSYANACIVRPYNKNEGALSVLLIVHCTEEKNVRFLLKKAVERASFKSVDSRFQTRSPIVTDLPTLLLVRFGQSQKNSRYRALNRVHNSRRPLDRLQCDFALCDALTL